MACETSNAQPSTLASRWEDPGRGRALVRPGVRVLASVGAIESGMGSLGCRHVHVGDRRMFRPVVRKLGEGPLHDAPRVVAVRLGCRMGPDGTFLNRLPQGPPRSEIAGISSSRDRIPWNRCRRMGAPEDPRPGLGAGVPRDAGSSVSGALFDVARDPDGSRVGPGVLDRPPDPARLPDGLFRLPRAFDVER